VAFFVFGASPRPTKYTAIELLTFWAAIELFEFSTRISLVPPKRELRTCMKFLLPILTVLWSLAAQAQTITTGEFAENVQRSNDVALVIAVEDYAFLPDITGVRSSATQWETFFRDDLGLSDVRVMVDAQAVREEILEAATRIGEAAKGRVWVVYVGHGAAADGHGLLLGADTQQTARSISSRGVSQQEVLNRVNASNASDVVFVVDACFSGKTPSGQPLLPNLQPVVPIETLALNAHTLVLSAAAGNEMAGPLADGSEPAFSFVLRGATRGWARGNDTTVRADEAIDYVQRELRTISGRTQTPQLSGLPSVVLTSGVSQARPEVASSPIKDSTPAPNLEVTASASIEPAGHIWKDYWLTAGGGAGVELKSEAFTPIVSVRGGVHLGNAAKQRYRLGAELTYLQGGNPNFDDAVDDIRRLENEVGPLGRPTDGEKVNRVLTSLVAGAAFDLGVILTTEASLGLNTAPGGRCDQWEPVDPSNTQSNFTCSRTESVSVTAVAGGRLGVNLGWTDLGLVFNADLASDEEVFVGLVLSFAMDR